jgi:rod shape-determining protein MreC
MFLEASATPAADIDRSEDVLLLHDQAEPIGPPAPAAPAGPPAGLAPSSSAPTPPTARAAGVSP